MLDFKIHKGCFSRFYADINSSRLILNLQYMVINYRKQVLFDIYLVVNGELTEARYVLGPLHQYKELLLHGLTHIVSRGHQLMGEISADRRRRHLQEEL